MIKTELYFGRNIDLSKLTAADRIQRDRSYVQKYEIDEFLSDIVSPRFPGFTVFHGQGYWQGKPEDSFVVVILGDDTEHTHDSINDIINYYKRTYYQDSVGHVNYDVNAEF